MRFKFCATLTISAFLLAPISVSAATYFVSPTGSDSANGSVSTPFKTLTKANTTITSGDTVILKNGIYQGSGNAYISITKSNTTWKAENQHQAIIDGGFGPGLLNGSWGDFNEVYNSACEPGSSFGPSDALIRIRSEGATSHIQGITIDGLFFRNSCGRAFSMGAKEGGRLSDITIKNNRMDWAFSTMVMFDAEGGKNPERIQNTKFLNNVLTRASQGDANAVRTGGEYCPEKDTDYCVAVGTSLDGENTLVKGNIIAWSRGEITPGKSINAVWEDNLIVGNKNNFYVGWNKDITFRNNLVYSPERYMRKPDSNDGSKDLKTEWHMTIRNEVRGSDVVEGSRNIRYYNNFILGTTFEMSGRHKNYLGSAVSSVEQVYVGQNTFSANSNSMKLLRLPFGEYTETDDRGVEHIRDPKITGIFENNIFDNSKNNETSFTTVLSTNDRLTFRNNIVPANAPAEMKANNAVVTDNPGLVNSIQALTIQEPRLPVIDIDVNALKTALDINNYRLKNTSPAINAGSTAGAINDTAIPQEARSQDYFRTTRTTPDIGAHEFGGVVPPTSPTPTLPDSPTPPPDGSPTPTGTTTLPEDVNRDGIISIFDYNRVIRQFGWSGNPGVINADINRDGKVDRKDMQVITSVMR